MKNILTYILFNIILGVILLGCSNSNEEFKTVKETKYQNIKGNKVATEEIVKIIRTSDDQPISILTRISNYSNDSRIKYLTGQSVEDGLQDYLLDSIYYNQRGNDTLKKSFVKLNSIWQPSQLFKKKYNDYDSVVYWVTERPFKPNHYYKREIFYKYNASKKLIAKTEFECMDRQRCDSILKTIYEYSNGDSEEKLYIYTNDEWKEMKSR
jgi:hypothetical protein